MSFHREYLGISKVIALLCALLTVVPSVAQSAAAEYRAKANFIANFPSFIEWPDDAFQSPKSSFLVCVFGDFSFGTSLAEFTRTVSVHGRKVEVKWIRKETELRACQILFVSRSEAQHYAKVFGAIRGSDVLTVGETPDFLEAGGVVAFTFQQDAVQFEVNLSTAEEARLRISSHLLALATRVVKKSGGAKS